MYVLKKISLCKNYGVSILYFKSYKQLHYEMILLVYLNVQTDYSN